MSSRLIVQYEDGDEAEAEVGGPSVRQHFPSCIVHLFLSKFLYVPALMVLQPDENVSPVV